MSIEKFMFRYLGFGQSGSHPNTRVLRVYAVSVFRTSPVFPTGYGPLRLSPSGKLGDPEVYSSVPPSSVKRIRLSVMWRTLQAVELSPCHARLAEQWFQRRLSTLGFIGRLLSPRPFEFRLAADSRISSESFPSAMGILHELLRRTGRWRQLALGSCSARPA